jgi:hypothetical protein
MSYRSDLMRSRRQQSGAALLLVMILLAVGMAAGISYVGAASLRMNGSANMTKAARCRYLAEAGLEHAALVLAESGGDSFDGQLYGPYLLDDSGITYEFWGSTTGNAGEYLITSRGNTGELVREVSAVVSFRNRYRDGVLAHSPEAYWELAETEGVACTDTIEDWGGTYRNGVALEGDSALSGGTPSCTFDGSNDYVDVGTGMEISGDELTILAWIRGASSGSGEDAIICQSPGGSSASNRLWSLSTKNSGRYPTFRVKTSSGSTQLKVSDVSLQNGQWYFIAAVYDGSKMIIYIDGEEVDSRSKSGDLETDTDGEVWLGSVPTSQGSYPWQGDLDEVAVFDKALSADEISDLYDKRMPTTEWCRWND